MARAAVSNYAAAKILEDHGEDVLGILLSRVEQNDMEALRIAVNKLVPNAEHKVKLAVGDLNTAEDILMATQSIIRAVTEGKVAVTIGNKLVNIMKEYVSIKRELELEPRIAELELLMSEKL